MTKEKTQTIEERILKLQCCQVIKAWDDFCFKDKKCPYAEVNCYSDCLQNTNQIISIVRADEWKRIREGIEKLRRFPAHVLSEKYGRYSKVCLDNLDMLFKLLSNGDANTKEGG